MEVQLTGESLTDTEWNRLLAPFLGDLDDALKALAGFEGAGSALKAEVTEAVKKYAAKKKEVVKAIREAEVSLVAAINEVYAKGPAQVSSEDWDALNFMHSSFYVIYDHNGFWPGSKDDSGKVIQELKEYLADTEVKDTVKELQSIVKTYRDRESDDDFDWEKASKV
jgi:hypothetical protein